MLAVWLLLHCCTGASAGHRSAPAAPPPVGAVAAAYLGETYVWGDIGTSGYDCSGFVQTVFRQAGLALPRSSRQQAHQGEPVALANVRPGDLLFFAAEPGSVQINHVGLALSRGRMIHAARGHHRVVISRWDSPYFLRRWVAARRHSASPTTPLRTAAVLPAASAPATP